MTTKRRSPVRGPSKKWFFGRHKLKDCSPKKLRNEIENRNLRSQGYLPVKNGLFGTYSFIKKKKCGQLGDTKIGFYRSK